MVRINTGLSYYAYLVPGVPGGFTMSLTMFGKIEH